MTAPHTSETGDERGRDPADGAAARYPAAAQAAELLAHRLSEPPPMAADAAPRRRWRDQSLSTGAVGVAVLHAGRGHPDLAHRWLTRAVSEDVNAAASCGLWFGAPALAFAVRAAGPQRYARVDRRLRDALTTLIDQRLAAADARITAACHPRRSEFDVVRGLTGLGALLLPDPVIGRSADRSADDARLRDVLSYLVRLTEPLAATDQYGGSVPGWWTHDVPASRPTAAFAAGHADLGAAHGISGPLSLLCLAAAGGIQVPGQQEAVQRICAWLDRWRQHGPTGWWWPQRITRTELHTGQVIEQTEPGRPSWCYGTAGIARAQQLAGIALRDPARQHDAEHALLRAVSDPQQLGGLREVSLCHGWAGTTAAVWHTAHDTAHPTTRTGLLDAATRLLAELGTRAVEGLDEGPEDDSIGGAVDRVFDRPYGLINGTAGAAAILHTLSTGATNGWPRCLLLA